MSSNSLDTYEYLTGEYLGIEPSTVELAKFEYSPLGKFLNKRLKEEDKKEGLFKRLKNIKDKNEELLNAFSKAPKNKVNNQNKQNKYLVYNSQHSFVKFKNIGEFKELPLDSMHKKLKKCHKKFTGLKSVTPQKQANKKLKENVLDNVGALFNDMYYIYKYKYHEVMNILSTKDKKSLYYTKLRLTDDYHCESENEEEQQISKKFNKKEPLKKPTEADMNEE